MGQHLSLVQSEQIEYNPVDYQFFQQFSSSRILDFIQQVRLPLSLDVPSSSSSNRPMVEIGWKLYFQLFTRIESQLQIDSETASRAHWHPATYMYAMERNTEEEVMYRPRSVESSSSLNDEERLPDAYTDDEVEDNESEDGEEERAAEEDRGSRKRSRPLRYSQEEFAQLSSEQEASVEYEAYM